MSEVRDVLAVVMVVVKDVVVAEDTETGVDAISNYITKIYTHSDYNKKRITRNYHARDTLLSSNSENAKVSTRKLLIYIAKIIFII